MESSDAYKQPFSTENLDESVPDRQATHRTTERIFRLLHLLTASDCTREDIFRRLKDHYNVSERDDPKVKNTSQRAGKMLRRDIDFLRQMGYEIDEQMRDGVTCYRLVKGSGPGSTFLFDQSELDALILLHALFTDPTQYTKPDPTHPLPTQSTQNPFAQAIVLLVERLTATLPAEQKKYFERWVRKPYIYFNLDTVTDYLPHRATIETIVQAIQRRQQIQFRYTSLQWQSTKHEHVDPYYIMQQDGHLYLIGYSHGSRREGVLEYRIDRIDAESIQLQRNMIDVERRRHPIEFSYWIDSSIARGGLSRRWLSHTIEREEPYIDADGKQKSRTLVKAKAYSDWRIIQQLHKYADKVELVEPPTLREKMKKEVERMYKFYQKE